MPVGGRCFARKVAGESFSGLGTDCRVKSARWSLVKKRRPVAPSGGPASSVKILTGISTLAPVLGITYFCHSVVSAKAVIGTRLTIKALRQWRALICSISDLIDNQTLNFCSSVRFRGYLTAAAAEEDAARAQ